jgi:hypothetical protein
MRPVPTIAMLAVLAVVATAAVTPVAVADGSRGGDEHVRVLPAFNVGGSSGGDLLGDWYAQNLALPAAHAPFGGSADVCLDLGRRGRVLSPAGGLLSPEGMTCVVRQDRRVLIVMTSADCSTAEPPPFYGKTEADQRSCAIGWAGQQGVTAINVSVDGRPAVDIHLPRFFAVSPQRFTVFNKDPVFGATPGPALFVAAGWIAEIRGMDRGRHDMTAIVSVNGAPLDPFIVHFIVVRGRWS